MAERPPEPLGPERARAETEPMWYVAVGREVYGPADAVALREWTAAGRLPGGAQVRRVDGDAWMPLATVPELRDIHLAAPPPPVHAATVPYAPTRRALASCPHCGGAVVNRAPVYGWPWGLWQRALKPEFVCGSCGAPMPFDRLPPDVKARVTRTMRRAFAAWIVVVVFVIFGIASPFLVALAYQ
jgi:hypothetical protein